MATIILIMGLLLPVMLFGEYKYEIDKTCKPIHITFYICICCTNTVQFSVYLYEAL